MFSLFLFIFLSCNKVDIKKEKPNWIKNPYRYSSKYSLVAVGSAKPSYYGEANQREIAIKRAISELSMQKKVNISNQTILVSKGDNLKEQTFYSSKSNYTSEESLKIKVLEVYKDKENIYVLVAEDDSGE